jgi:hypothetical protein
MTGENPHDLIDNPFTLEPAPRWLVDSLTSTTAQRIKDFRHEYHMLREDQTEAHARVDAANARNALIRYMCDQVAQVWKQFTAMEDELKEFRRADAERAARDARLDAEPDLPPPGTVPPDDPPPGTDADEPTELELTHVTDDAPAPSLGGDLHVIPPVEVEDEDPEPDVDGTPRPPSVPQPISISLNEQ